MNNEEEKKVINTTILNTGIAKPISISKEEAMKIARENNVNVSTQNNVVSPSPISKEEIEEQKVNELNDLMKNDYVKLVEVKHSKITYIILFLVLAALVGIIIYEIIYFGGKM